MEFRKAVESDNDNIMNIINQAKDYFKEQGIDQWQDNYPNPEVIRNDIADNNGYVLLDDNKIIATAAVSFNGEEIYDVIYNGEWISYDKFAVVHRIAIDNNYKGKGLSSIILEYAEKMCLEKDVHSIKIDTHKDNKSMQKLLKKNKFEYCGIIHLEDKSERLAFEKILSDFKLSNFSFS